MSLDAPVTCPRCHSTNLWKNGKHHLSHEQRYLCKDCRHQFVPGHVRVLKHPQLTCPRCGSPMHFYHHRHGLTRFRCSRYRDRGKRRCNYKLNFALDGSRRFQLITQPTHIQLIAGQVDAVFHWKRMDFTKATVVMALYYSICEGLPAPQVVRSLWNLHHVKVSHDTITRWQHKAAFQLSLKTAGLAEIPSKPGRKPRLYADETERKVAGHKRWFWMSYCRKYDLMIGRNLTTHRSTKGARDLLAMTHRLAPTLKASQLLTDGLWSYPAALGDLDIPDDRHIRYLSFFESPNNNALERKWSNFHVRAKPFRGFKSDLGQMAFIEGQIFYHNCLKPSVHLGGELTPYQNLHAKLPAANSQLELIARLLT